MKDVELYAKVRHAVRIEGLSKRAVARRFGIDPRTVDKMLEFSVPPGYRRTRPPVKPKLGPFIGIIDAILAEDKGRPKKQQHTSKRIFERLRDEHGYTGGRKGLRGAVPAAIAGDVRAAGASARTRAGRLWRSHRDHRRGGTQDPFLRNGPAALGCVFCGGVSGGDDGSVLRRARSGLCVLWRGPAVDPVRQHQNRGGAHSG